MGDGDLSIDKIMSYPGAKGRVGNILKGLDAEGGVSEGTALGGADSFKGVLGQYIGQVNSLQHEADSQIQKLAAGKTEDVHQVMVAMDEASTSFELMMEIRNKLVDAYKELGRMQG